MPMPDPVDRRTFTPPRDGVPTGDPAAHRRSYGPAHRLEDPLHPKKAPPAVGKVLVCDQCHESFDPADVVGDECPNPKCGAEAATPVQAELVRDGEAGAKDAKEPTTEDLRAAVEEILGPLKSELEAIGAALETKRTGFGRLGLGGGTSEGATEALAAARKKLKETADGFVTVLEAERRSLVAERRRLEAERTRAESTVTKQAERFAVVRAEVEQKQKMGLALADEKLKVAREAMATVEEARGQRDEATGTLNTLRSQVLGLARSLGFRGQTADEKAAIAWLLKSARGPASEDEKLQKDAALADKLARVSLIVDLEQRAASAPDEVTRGALNLIVAEWRSAYEVGSTRETAKVDASFDALKARLAAASEATLDSMTTKEG